LKQHIVGNKPLTLEEQTKAEIAGFLLSCLFSILFLGFKRSWKIVYLFLQFLKKKFRIPKKLFCGNFLQKLTYRKQRRYKFALPY